MDNQPQDPVHMKFDRRIWKDGRRLVGTLPWPCPCCGGKSLRLQGPSIQEAETRDSSRSHGDDGWWPDWVEHRFCCLLECHSCKEIVALTGTSSLVEVEGYDEEVGSTQEWVPYYHPTYFLPPPQIFELPKNTPEGVAANVKRAFSLYWTDSYACGNAIRAAVEELLTSQRIRKSTGRPKPGGHWKLLNLHGRIELFAKRNSSLGEKLLAIKWIGNAASHVDALRRDDLLDAFEILAFVLDELYVQRAAHVGQLVKAINRQKGPRKSSATRKPRS